MEMEAEKGIGKQNELIPYGIVFDGPFHIRPVCAAFSSSLWFFRLFFIIALHFIFSSHEAIVHGA